MSKSGTITIDLDDYASDISDETIKEEYEERFGVKSFASPDQLAADLRKAFADQDKIHFDVLIDRMLQDAGCA
jgi:hypothetical protein